MTLSLILVQVTEAHFCYKIACIIIDHFKFDFSPLLSDIEQLTHKTGNFKEFSIFCSMLESGLKKVGFHIFCY